MSQMEYQPPRDPSEIDWKIVREGRAWEQDEVRRRYELAPGKMELIEGKIFWSDEDRLRMLGLLLENCGADAAVRFGDPDVWRKAVASLADPEATFRHEVESAHRRWDQSSGNAAEALRFHEQTTTLDFVEYITVGGAATPTTREQILETLRRVIENPPARSPGYSFAKTRTDAVNFEGDRAAVLLSRTLRHQCFDKVSDTRWQGLPELTEVERWQETWTQTEDGWRLQRRDRIEGPWAVKGGDTA